MVTRNEAGRYLKEAVDSIRPLVDNLFVYDDRSTDETAIRLAEWKVPHIVRKRSHPSFLDNEDVFRQNAWERMEAMFGPRPGDWIITLDADEQLRTSHELITLAQNARDMGQDALWMHVHEVWEEGKIRVDGFWPSIKALRFCEWKPDATFKHRRTDEGPVHQQMGGGSLPDYVSNPGRTHLADILHFGYFRASERQRKMERYLSIRDSGHNKRHLKSIITTPTLAPLPEMV